MRLFRNLLIIIFIFGLTAQLLQADDFLENYNEPSIIRESIRARGMGNAFTAVANDEMVLYYNPAGLRSVQYNYYELLTFNLTTNENTLKLAGSDDASSEISNITGKKLYNEINVGLLNHINSRFGWSLFNNTVIDIELHNPVIPSLETLAYTQTGIVAGIAWSFFDYQLDVGIGGKVVQRTGTATTLSIFDEAIINASKGDTVALEEMFEEGKQAIAPDLGITYHLEGFHNSSPKLALSALNIGGLDFGAAGKVPMTMNFGVASESELSGFDFILSMDYYDLTNGQKLATGNNTLTERNLKIGFEVGWEKLYNGHHFFSFRSGRNGPYNSIGATLNLFGIKFDAAKYSQEVGGYAGETEDKRTSIQISLLF